MSDILVEVIKTRRYKAGYVVRREKCIVGDDNLEVILDSAYTDPGGDYIGSSVWAYRLIRKRGIAPEKADPNHNVCSIGFCEREQKWYGWSHRAMYGFGIGDVVKEGDCTAESGWIDEYLEDHPEADRSLPTGFIAKTLEDAKLMAIAFADSVG